MKRRGILSSVVFYFLSWLGFKARASEPIESGRLEVIAFLKINNFTNAKFSDKLGYWEKSWIHPNERVEHHNGYKHYKGPPSTLLKVDETPHGWTVGVERSGTSYGTHYTLIGIVNSVSQLELIHSFINGVRLNA